MYLPENLDDFAKSNRTNFSKTKIKPHLPADPVGQRYIKYFWHPFSAIVAPVPTIVSKPAWSTINYYLQASQLWSLHADNKQLVGVRFGSETLYATIDLDFGGDYHNYESIKRIKGALEDIGIVDIVPIQSSFSGGYHLIITFTSLLPTFNLACAIEQTLKDAGFIIRKGHLEIFPNVKPWAENCIINYNAIRCPMQPGSGALLLNNDLQPISDDVSIFLNHCDFAARRQDLTKLKYACKKARLRHNRERYHKKASANVEEWRANWEEIIATGWTGRGQTNTLLQIFVGYGIVFLDLEGDKLVEFCLSTAINASGYTQYCRHQHEIETRVRHWVECTIRHKWYTPYASYPERLLGTFSATFAEALRDFGRLAKKPKDNVIPFDRRQAQNNHRSQSAQRRIRWAVNALEWGEGLPCQSTERSKAISGEYKRQFNKTLSLETLHKHKYLWHPNSYIADPWAEKSNYGHIDNFLTPETNQKAQNPYQTERYGHSPYMKVLCLPPAATAPQGLEPAEVVEQTSVCQSDSGVTQSAENVEFINYSNSPENDLNQLSNQLENSVTTNILQSNSLTSNQDFIYSYSSGESPKSDKQNLSFAEDNGLDVVSTPAVVPSSSQEIALNGYLGASEADLTPALRTSEPLRQNANNAYLDASCRDATADTDARIEQLKRVTKLRLMALTKARAKVRQYCMIVGRIISGSERSHLEQIAKMQFYLDSGDEMLVAEAEAWAAANPGCLPFSLESAFARRADS
ncbi:hypothetical protein OGM63_26885 [Plectonema radiosum NIES-515]|uniref:Replication-related protein n=1 Tax=Plectonema radiosum NIES-515 TaxID=2986073 RepID=A0ABT3B6U1_9CYAN|nr:hypothetical protein [Plectonema radiosum]MCV3217091.1 hypothetical protein [Plectonema radiosum NIES-515]